MDGIRESGSEKISLQQRPAQPSWGQPKGMPQPPRSPHVPQPPQPPYPPQLLQDMPQPPYPPQVPQDAVPPQQVWPPATPPVSMQYDRFGARDWLAFAFSAVLAILLVAVFNTKDFSSLPRFSAMLPGVGVTLVVVASFAFFFVVWRGQLSFKAPAVVLLVATVLLACAPALFSNSWLRMLDYVVLWFAATLCALLLTGTWDKSWARLDALGNAVLVFFSALFSDFLFRPWRAMQGVRKGGWVARGLIIGAVAAIAMLFVVLPLLSFADSRFADLMRKALDLISLDGLWNLLWVFLLTPACFALLWGFVRRSRSRAFERSCAAAAAPSGPALFERMNPVAVLTVLVVLDAVYLIFVGVQISHLFEGVEGVVADGTFSGYLHAGFYQLVAVAIINIVIGVVFVRVSARGGVGHALRACNFVLVACTAVILVSSCWRLFLYIDAYGLTLPRMTVLFMSAFVLCCLVALVVKLAKQNFAFMRVALSSALVLWIAFIYANPDASVANYNVERFITAADAGQSRQLDVSYIEYALSPDSVPALRRLSAYLDEHPDARLRKYDKSVYDQQSSGYYRRNESGSASTPLVVEPGDIDSVYTSGDIDEIVQAKTLSADGIPWQYWSLSWVLNTGAAASSA